VSEKAALFGRNRSLVGVVTDPTNVAPGDLPIGVLLLGAGLVHRVGPHRFYVKLARRLAACGLTVARFDYSGIGDSPARVDNAPYAKLRLEETQEVMDDLMKTRGIEHFCLMGISSGAVASFGAAVQDRRVIGAVLLNAMGFDSSGTWTQQLKRRDLVKAYPRKLLDPHSWWRALTGKSEYGRWGEALRFWIKRLVKRPQSPSDPGPAPGEAARRVLESEFSILLVSSEGDHSADYFLEILGPGWQPLLGERLSRATIREADHTFGNPKHQIRILDVIEEWIMHNVARRAAGKAGTLQ
jgi:pimeloyl-ACP methyl ester carboxylesterase